ncbi:MAG: bifunctional phosphopantothenoylcysteine decarboxylase/phosphopantothenate--cysteine ligase CoaBC [Candidatus Hydrothermarchaeales archaeon]
MQLKSSRLKGMRIAHCVTGSVAAIEAPKIARELKRHGAQVQVYMSRAAQKIIHPYTMQFAAETVVTKLTGGMEHLREFDLVLIAPATATTMSKIAVGIADSPVTALALASRAKMVIAPAMAMKMYESRALKENIEKLKARGCVFVEPKFEEGKAKLAQLDEVVDAVIAGLVEKNLAGMKVVVTAGPTIEYIDPLRIITNKSSGMMGIELAKEAYRRGAEVKLIYAPGCIEVPRYLDVARVETSAEMLSQVKKSKCDVFVFAAAVADFSPKKAREKIDSKKGCIELNLYPTPKIIDEVQDSKAVRVAFKALHNASGKELKTAAKNALAEYHVDIAVANDASKVMGAEDSEVYIATEKSVEHVPLVSKAEVAKRIWDTVKELKK